MSLQEIIKQGENDKVEFKETFWYDIKTALKNRDLKNEITKALCGLLNHYGGLLLIGVSDNCVIKGLERDLSLFSGDIIKNRDNLLKDVHSICTEHLGHQFINLLIITYKTVNEKEILTIEVSPSDEPVFHKNNTFFLRNGPQTIVLDGPKLASYILKRFGNGEKEESLLSLTQNVPGLDERVRLLKKIIKNLMITYYSEGLSEGVYNPYINNLIYKITKILNLFDNSTLEDYIREGSAKPNYNKLSRIFFGCSREAFSDKLINNEITLDPINRTKLVLAGDIAFILYKWYEENTENDVSTLEDIYEESVTRTDRFRQVKISSDISQKEFLGGVEILVGEKIIDLSYNSENPDLKDTEWNIINDSKLIAFYQLKSLFYLLEQEDIKELQLGRSGFCIRCKRNIPLNLDHPFCYYCFRSWAKYHNWNYLENFCHNCGESTNTSRSKPLCDNCYHEEE